MLLGFGARLGPYEIHSALGAGGMGEVYRGVDTRLGRQVAIKVLKPEIAADPVFRARFEREARTISQLDHPAICTLYDVGQEGATAFLVMQYLEGVPLSERIRGGALPVSEVVRIGVSLASALASAHARGIVHRDVKPHNVIQLSDGRVKLLDFGIAKPLGLESGDTTAETRTTLTRVGHMLGTPEYMAPEQLAGRDADEHSDMFSLGVLLYELAAAAHPFRQATPALTLAAILEAKYPGLPGASGAAARLDAVLRRMLDPVPTNRYPSMGDCVEELRRIEAAPVPGDGVPARVRGTPLAWPIAGAGVLAAAGLLVILLPSRSGQEQRPATSGAATAPPATVAASPHAPVADPDMARVTYWLDVEPPAGADGPIRGFRSVGDEVFGNGWRFRVNVAPASAGSIYVVADEASRADESSRLTMLFASEPEQSGAAVSSKPVTTGWFVFTGLPAREMLWLVWSPAPVAELAPLASLINSRDLGVIQDSAAARRARQFLTGAAARKPSLAVDRSAIHATLQAPHGPVVHRLELHHE